MSSYSIPQYLGNIHSVPYKERKNIFEKALIEHPEDKDEIEFMLADYYANSPDTMDKGLEMLKKITETSAKMNLVSFSYWLLMFYHFEEKKDSAKAIVYGYKTLEIEPNSLEVMEKFCEIFKAGKQWDNVLLWAEKLIDDDSYYDLAYDHIIDVRLELKEYDLAIEAGEKWLTKTPSCEKAMCSMAIGYLGKQNYTKCREILKQVLLLNKDNTTALYTMGLSYQEQDDFYRAMDYYTKALHIKPNFPEVYNNIGKLYYDHESDYKGAIAYFERAIKSVKDPLGQELAAVYLNLSKIYGQMLEKDKSDYYLRKWHECFDLEFLFDITHGLIRFEDDDDENEDDNDESDDMINDEE